MFYGYSQSRLYICNIYSCYASVEVCLTAVVTLTCSIISQALNGFLLVLSTNGNFVYVSKSIEDLSGLKKVSWCMHVLIDNISTVWQCKFIKPLHPNISMHTLYTPLYTFILELTGGINNNISSLGWRHFLWSHDLNEWFSSITERKLYTGLVVFSHIYHCL